MHTGTLINDLMATVVRVGRTTESQLIEQRELHEIFAMQIPVVEGDHVYMGAA
ncbi:MAG TPA: hypothetical protein VH350_13995 [Candidatus Sulfotelmatobacter sp.]|nr:hypothetical protein [Candidatus Sulfotelmatobacter sp.]